MKIVLPLGLLLMMAGCVPPSRIETHRSGSVIPAGSRYLWFVPEGEAPHLSEARRARLALALAGRGLTSVSPGEKADYLLLVTQARRGAETGLAPSVTPPGQEPAWIAPPGKRGRQVSTLELKFLDPATGRQIAAIAAVGRHGRRETDAMPDRLIDAALGTGL